MEIDVQAGLTPAKNREFGLKVGAAFLVLAGLSWWRGHEWAPIVMAVLGGSLVLGGALVPSWLRPAHVLWFGLARVLSKITTPIILGLMYFGLLTPTGLVSRIIGRRPLRAAAGDDGYWVNRPADARQRRDMHHQF